MEILRTTELTKVFHQGDEEICAVDHVNLTVEEGEFLVVTGRSGSGKTTLLNILACIDKADSGSVVIDGEDVSALSSSQLSVIRRRKLGYIFQDFNLLNILTAEENIKMPAFLDSRNPDKEKFTRLVTDLGIADRLTHLPNELSGGQKQRVAIAGVMAMEPKCIILDEPTAMLDPNGRKEVLRAVRELNKEKGITIIFITQYMEEVVNADRVYVMDSGKVVMEGTPREIFSQVERLKELRLDVPQITLLAHDLRKAGLDLPEGILTRQELVESLCQLY